LAPVEAATKKVVSAGGSVEAAASKAQADRAERERLEQAERVAENAAEREAFNALYNRMAGSPSELAEAAKWSQYHFSRRKR
jgi:hypothetical protein